MKDWTKAKRQLIRELARLRRRVAELEALEIELRKAGDALRYAEFAISQLEQDVDECLRREKRWRCGKTEERCLVLGCPTDACLPPGSSPDGRGVG